MNRRSAVTFLPRRTSITSSVGTRTSSISSSRFCSATDCLICSAIFFSKFERTLTEYHRFAIFELPLSFAGRDRPKVFDFRGFHPKSSKQKSARNLIRRAPCSEVCRQLPVIALGFKGQRRIFLVFSRTGTGYPANRRGDPDRPAQRTRPSARP